MKRSFLLGFVLLLFFAMSSCVSDQRTNEAEKGKGLLVNLEEATLILKGEEVSAKVPFKGQVLFDITKTQEGYNITLNSFSMLGESINTPQGETGRISLIMDERTLESNYIEKDNMIQCEFNCYVHYPLIDELIGFKKQEDFEENDYFESYKEVYKAKLQLKLQSPVSKSLEAKSDEMEAELMMDFELAEEYQLGLWQTMNMELEHVVIDVIYISNLKVINIQPVFIRYFPDEGCNNDTATATTGGSYEYGKEKAIEMWGMCCIKLNFLPVQYIHDNDLRIYQHNEYPSYRSAVDEADAIEVYYVESFDPNGMYGGGVCYSLGTANSFVVTSDNNLPINVYNLAHELGHAIDLRHPGTGSNSTAGTLMEPSGFCADNPPFMSEENCNNASNPLFYVSFPGVWCIHNTNFP